MDDRRDDDDSLDELLARALPGVVRLPEDERRRAAPRRRPPGQPPEGPRPPAGQPSGRRPAPHRRRAAAAPSRFAVERYGEIVTALAPGADPRWLDRLRAGAVPPEASLDLHGLTADAAAVALDAFLARTAPATRCLLVVHGRGRRSPAGPVLKEEVVRRLLSPPHAARIVALATAPPAHGGAGALLVLLRAGSILPVRTGP